MMKSMKSTATLRDSAEGDVEVAVEPSADGIDVAEWEGEAEEGCYDGVSLDN